MAEPERSFLVGGGLLETLEVLKLQCVADMAAVEIGGPWRWAFPLPVFRMSVGKSQHAPMLMSSGWDIQPLGEFGGIKEKPFVNGPGIFVKKRERLRGMPYRSPFVTARFNADG